MPTVVVRPQSAPSVLVKPQYPAQGSVVVRRGGQSQSIDSLSDVSATDPSDGDVLVYDSSSDTWIAQKVTIESLSLDIIDGGTY